MEIVLDRTLHISFPESSDESLHDITVNIEENSVSLSELLFSSGNIQYGSYNSTMFEVVLYNIPDVTSQHIQVYTETANIGTGAVVGRAIVNKAIVGTSASGSNITYLFDGFVDSCKLDNLGHYRQIVAYDYMYTMKDRNVAMWWDSFWTTTTTSTTLKQLRQSLCNYVQIPFDNTTVHFNDSLIVKPKNTGIQNINFSQMLAYICELQATFPHVNRRGILEFIDLTNVTTHDIRNNYEQVSSEFEDYETDKVTQVVVTLDDEEIYRTSSLSTNVYTISNNLLLYDYDNSEIEIFANNYLNKIRDIQYIPASVVMICSDLDIKVGDIVITDQGNVRVFSNELSGNLLVEQTISASGEQRYGEVTSSFNVTFSSLADRIAETANTLERDYITADIIDANYISTRELEADVATLGYLKVVNLDAENANLGYLKANEIDANYAKINLANVNNAWIENGVIKNAAISNEMVLSVSADKLTAGTIDAANIRVVHLNASDITTGKLTVDGITIDVEANEAVIDGNYIEDGTITLNGFAEDVVNKLNESVQTYTTDTIPLLINYPASNWTTNSEKDTHIGDICYVVNPVASEDGYCYRFNKDSNNNYSWVLIKDKDITNVLLQLVNVDGEISNLKSFESTTVGWITSTDEELGSLKIRTTNLETDIGDKVSTSTFNEVKQTVDSNSSTITSLTETKANKDELTALINRVSSIEQTSSNITLSVSELSANVLNSESETTSPNILRNASTMPTSTNGYWADGEWIAQNAVVTTEIITGATPISNLNIVVKISKSVTTKAGVAIVGRAVAGASTTGTPYVRQRNYTITSDKIGSKLVLSGWFKGTSGDTFTLTAITGESQSFELESNNWEYKYFTTEEIVASSTVATIGGISLDSVTNSLYVCGLKLEYGSYPSSWDVLTTEVAYQSAQLDIQAGSITSLVTEVFPNGTTNKSSIEQNADNIELKVSKDGVIASINNSGESVTINANKINLNGAVTISDLDSSLKSDIVSSTTSKNQYYLSTSSTSLTGGSWYDSPDSLTWSSGKFVWTRVATTYTLASGTSSTVYSTAVYDKQLTTSLSTSSSALSTATTASSTATNALSIANSAFRSNLVLRPYFNSSFVNSTSPWSKENNATLVYNSSTDLLEISCSSSYYGIYQALTLEANTDYVISAEVGSAYLIGIGTSNYPTDTGNWTIADDGRVYKTFTTTTTTSYRIYLYANTTYATTYVNRIKIEKGSTYTGWQATDEELARIETTSDTALNSSLRTTQSVYYRSTTHTTPSINSSTSITGDGDTDNVWGYILPKPKRNCYFYTCEMYTYGSGSIGFTAVREMSNLSVTSGWCSTNDSTVIDGASIYAGSITATQIEAGTITGNELSATAINGMKIVGATLTTNTNRTTYNSTTSGLTMTSSGIGAGNGTTNTFAVTSSGQLTCTSATIRGSVTATDTFVVYSDAYSKQIAQLWALDAFNSGLSLNEDELILNVQEKPLEDNAITGTLYVYDDSASSTYPPHLELSVVKSGTARSYLDLSRYYAELSAHNGSDATNAILRLVANDASYIKLPDPNYAYREFRIGTSVDTRANSTFVVGTNSNGGKFVSMPNLPNYTVTSYSEVYMSSTGVLGKSGGSSQRWKTDIRRFNSSEYEYEKDVIIDGIRNIPVALFKYTPGHFNDEEDYDYNADNLGMIAEDVAENLPIAAVFNNADKSLVDDWNTRQIIPAILLLAQEAMNKVEELESRLGGNNN